MGTKQAHLIVKLQKKRVKRIMFPYKTKSYFFLTILLLILYPAISLADADRIFKENNKAVV
ncbi:MAG: hypothetical protein ACUVUQ_10890, partial [Thermodesulfovibrionales bacterium]